MNRRSTEHAEKSRVSLAADQMNSSGEPVQNRAVGWHLPDGEGAPGIRTCAGCGAVEVGEYLRAPDRYHGRGEIYGLARCENCGLVWLQDPPSASEMSRHYGPHYDRSVRAAGRDPRRWRGRSDELQRYKSGGSILDLGCSAGGFLATLDRAKWKTYGIEMSAEVAGEAAARTGADIFAGEILEAPFAAGTFDAITCFHVFEHMYHPRSVLSKVCEWLKPDGIFYAMMPNIDSAGTHLFQSYWYGLELPRHLYHFSPRSLKKMAEGVGLDEVSITTHREPFIEASTRYYLDGILRRLGIVRTPLAMASECSIPFKIVRKAFRLTVLPVLNRATALAGDGESIHAVFRKRVSR